MSGQDFDKLMKKIKNSSQEDKEELAEKIKSSLSENQAKSLSEILQNEEMLKKLLSSDKAKEILDKIGGDKNGHK